MARRIKERKATCGDCGAPFVAPNSMGPLPRRCRACQKPDKLKRSVERALASGAPMSGVAAYLGGEGSGVSSGISDDVEGPQRETRMVKVLRLASYLAHYGEEVALGFLGLGAGEDSATLVADAKRLFPEVCKNSPGAMQTVVLAGALQSFHTLITRSQAMSGPAASQAFKSAMQALDAIQSSSSASYTSINISIPGLEVQDDEVA